MIPSPMGPGAHSQKIAYGTLLNDEDSAFWLEQIRDGAYSLKQKNKVGIIACSALKRQYRNPICTGNESKAGLSAGCKRVICCEWMG
ncbi:MAG: hypothetical protein ACRC4P_03595 [Aeromonas sp.]